MSARSSRREATLTLPPITPKRRAGSARRSSALKKADQAALDAAAAANTQEQPAENVEPEFVPTLPLVRATQAGDLDSMTKLIRAVSMEQRLDYVNQHDKNGKSAIFYAVSLEQPQCAALALLLDYGADPNARDDRRHTPLHSACKLVHKKAIRMLLVHGADPFAENWQYNKPEQMLSGDAARVAMQAFMNGCLEAQAERVSEKKVYPCVRQQRAYYRSLFDIIDQKNTGLISMDEVVPLLRTMFHPERPPPTTNPDMLAATANQEQKISSGSSSLSMSSALPIPLSNNGLAYASVSEDKPLPQGQQQPDDLTMIQFFGSMDADKNGVLTFTEFLHGVLSWQAEQERLRKKEARKAKMRARAKAKAKAKRW